jgi:Tfp pilus assembly protein PilF/TolB-like protein
LRAGPAPLQAGKARISVAVLPLARDRAADPHGGLAYLCEGIADELHAGLARRQDIRLASRGVSVGIARISRDLASLRAGLDVDWVLDGALAPLGELLEVRLRLVALSSGQAAWERRVRVRRGEMGPLELALAQGLSAAAGCEPCPLPDAQPVAPEAWDAYLRGRYHWRKRPRDSAQALEALREAVARAPGFALAQSALADIYNTLGSWEAAAMPGLDAFPRAQGAALAALCVDPRCAEAHTALAYSTMHYLWQWDTASSQFERAIALNPNYAHAHHWHSHYQAARGQVSASLASSLRALALDPLDQVINVHLAWHYWLAGEPGNAIEQAARSGRLDPDDQWVHFFTALGHGSLGDAGAAVEASRRALALCAGSPVMLAGLAWAHAIAGDAAQARRLSRELTPPGGRVGMSYERAVIAAALGEPDLALEQLDAAVQERSAWLAYAAVDPRLKVLRGNERFDAILRTVGLVDMSR